MSTGFSLEYMILNKPAIFYAVNNNLSKLNFFDSPSMFFFCLFLAETFKQVARTVTGVNLTDNIVDVVYKMFDENGKTLILIIRLFILLKGPPSSKTHCGRLFFF